MDVMLGGLTWVSGERKGSDEKWKRAGKGREDQEGGRGGESPQLLIFQYFVSLYNVMFRGYTTLLGFTS